MAYTISFLPFLHRRPFQHLEKSQLQLVWPHGKHVVEGSAEAFIPLQRQPRDEIQMDMYVARIPQGRHIASQSGNVHRPVYLPQRLLVGGLDAYLKLYLSRPQSPQQRQLRFRQNVPRYLEVKIRHTVVPFSEKTPYFHGPDAVTVESPVDEFHLRDAFSQEISQLCPDRLQIPVS